MARSKISTPSGKRVTPKKKRDTNAQASITIGTSKRTASDGSSVSHRRVTKKNDGDPSVYYRNSETVHGKGGAKTTTKIKSKTKSKAAANPLKGKSKSFLGIGGAKESKLTKGSKDSPARRRLIGEDKVTRKHRAEMERKHRKNAADSASDKKKYAKKYRKEVTAKDSKGRRTVRTTWK